MYENYDSCPICKETPKGWVKAHLHGEHIIAGGKALNPEKSDSYQGCSFHYAAVWNGNPCSCD